MSGLRSRSARGYRVVESQIAYTGAILGVRKDLVAFPDGTTANRDIITHHGAVAVVALDDQHRVAMIEQYRHSVRGFLWELPAGLRDVAGEDPLLAARRELLEEVGLVADTWHTLVDVVLAPGYGEEVVRVYLARDLQEQARPDDFELEHEEADLVMRWVPLAEAVDAVHQGLVTNSLAVGGLLAADRAVGDESLLRPADAPWFSA